MCVLRNEATQKHLLSKSDLTLPQAVEIAQSMEAAERNTQQLEWDSTAHSVKPVSERKRSATAVVERTICLPSVGLRTPNVTNAG